ncbi:MAG TPA: hypothetical protein VIT91_11205 [Chthoniobacterales bacterium]
MVNSGSWTALIQFLVFAALIAVPPGLLRTVPDTIPESDRLNVPAELDRMRTRQPDFFMIGNSMLDSRIDVPCLEKLSGMTFLPIVRHGSASAIWYLILKDLIVASDTHPRGVIIFFRNRELTRPQHHTSGRNANFIRSLRQPREPVLDQLAPSSAAFDGSPVGRLRAFFAVCYPMRQGLELDQKIRNLAMDLTPSDLGKRARRAELDQVFAVGNLDVEGGADPVAGNGVDGTVQDADDSMAGDDASGTSLYADNPEESFLPHMLDLATKASTKLYFYRVKEKPDSNGNVERSPNDIAYSEKLGAYLEKHGAVLIDESPDRSIPASIYSDGTHVRTDAMNWYTRKFWNRMEPILK